MSYAVQDAQLKQTKALPNGAATIYSDGFDLGAMSALGRHVEDCELLISSPALSTAQQPDAKTITYSIQADTDPAWGTVKTLMGSVLIVTGAGGAGCAAAQARVKLPTNCPRYVRLMAVGSATGDASAASATFQLVF
jgi:hypothetical protein